MTDDRVAPPRQVPILTEVVTLAQADAPTEPLPASAAAAPVAEIDAVAPRGADDELLERVWQDLQRQVDLMLEYRLRETLTPILSRATEAVLRDTRQQLASTLRDVVAKAVAEELARHRAG